MSAEVYQAKKNLQPGDQVINHGIVRQITSRRETGYTWIYPDTPDKEFLSEDSCDPFFGWGWQVLTPSTST